MPRKTIVHYDQLSLPPLQLWRAQVLNSQWQKHTICINEKKIVNKQPCVAALDALNALDALDALHLG